MTDFVPTDNSPSKSHVIEGREYDRVSTVLDVVDKAALKFWAAGLAADAAFEHLPQLVASQLVRPCGNTNNRCHLKHGRQNSCERCPCGGCQPCWRRRLAYRHELESRRRSEEGIEVHQVAEAWVGQDGIWLEHRQSAAPYVAQFKQWLVDFGLTPQSFLMTEARVFDREKEYAGTTDGVLRIEAIRSPMAKAWLEPYGVDTALVRVNYKTREKPDEQMYNDTALQEVAYDRCPLLYTRGETVLAHQPADMCAILQLRPGSYSFKPVRVDDATYAAWLGVLAAYRWLVGPAKDAFKPPPKPLPAKVPFVDAPVGVRTAAPILGAGYQPPDDDPWAGALEPPAPEVDGWPQVADLPESVDPTPPARPAPAKKATAKRTTAKKTATPDPTDLAAVAAHNVAQSGRSAVELSAMGLLTEGAQLGLLDDEIPF